MIYLFAHIEKFILLLILLNIFSYINTNVSWLLKLVNEQLNLFAKELANKE